VRTFTGARVRAARRILETAFVDRDAPLIGVNGIAARPDARVMAAKAFRPHP
jgi:hypothetical protein